MTHFEVRRGRDLLLRIAIADGALADVGDELGALLRRIAPSAVATTVAPGGAPDPVDQEFVVMSEHPHDVDTDAYHAGLRERLSELFSSLCDTSLADALDIAREERARRAEGRN